MSKPSKQQLEILDLINRDIMYLNDPNLLNDSLQLTVGSVADNNKPFLLFIFHSLNYPYFFPPYHRDNCSSFVFSWKIDRGVERSILWGKMVPFDKRWFCPRDVGCRLIALCDDKTCLKSNVSFE